MLESRPPETSISAGARRLAETLRSTASLMAVSACAGVSSFGSIQSQGRQMARVIDRLSPPKLVRHPASTDFTPRRPQRTPSASGSDA